MLSTFAVVRESAANQPACRADFGQRFKLLAPSDGLNNTIITRRTPPGKNNAVSVLDSTSDLVCMPTPSIKLYNKLDDNKHIATA